MLYTLIAGGPDPIQPHGLRTIDSERTVKLMGGLLFGSWSEAADHCGDLDFTTLTFSKMRVDGHLIYIPNGVNHEAASGSDSPD